MQYCDYHMALNWHFISDFALKMRLLFSISKYDFVKDLIVQR